MWGLSGVQVALTVHPESIPCFLTKRKNEGASKSKLHDVYVEENAEKVRKLS